MRSVSVLGPKFSDKFSIQEYKLVSRPVVQDLIPNNDCNDIKFSSRSSLECSKPSSQNGFVLLSFQRYPSADSLLLGLSLKPQALNKEQREKKDFKLLVLRDIFVVS